MLLLLCVRVCVYRHHQSLVESAAFWVLGACRWLTHRTQSTHRHKHWSWRALSNAYIPPPRKHNGELLISVLPLRLAVSGAPTKPPHSPCQPRCNVHCVLWVCSHLVRVRCAGHNIDYTSNYMLFVAGRRTHPQRVQQQHQQQRIERWRPRWADFRGWNERGDTTIASVMCGFAHTHTRLPQRDEHIILCGRTSNSQKTRWRRMPIFKHNIVVGRVWSVTARLCMF